MDNSMNGWKEEMILKVTDVCTEGVASWASLIDLLGVPEPIRTEWVTTFLSEVKSTMIEMHTDLEERQKNMQKVIIDLKNKIGEICYDLGLTAELSQESNLYLEESKLKTYLNKLEIQLSQKQKEVQHLLKRQETICATLGKPQKLLNDKPLPSTEELENFLLYIESLEDECFLREEKFTATQCELQTLAAEIDYQPANEFEEQILKDKTRFEVNDKNMIKLNSFQQTLQQHAQNVKTEVEIFLEQIKQLWSTLETDERHCSAFLQAHSGYGKQTINALKMEIKRLEDLKKANIEMLIKRLQSQLVLLWDKCHFSEEQRQAFDLFDDDIYTESMLTLFQNEVRKVTKLYEDNKLLYESLIKYEETWKRIDELETPLQGQDRFKNRGGKLLIEEKERKLTRKRLEKLEFSIMKMIEEYYENKQEVFTYEGVSVEDYLKSVQESKDELKLGKVSSKGTISAASTMMEGPKSSQKVMKPLQPSNIPSTTKRRNAQYGDAKNCDTSSQKTQPSISGITNSAPERRNNPIRQRKNKLKKNQSVSNVKKSKLIRNAIQQGDTHLLSVVPSYRQFKNIVDTSMPMLINNTMDATIYSVKKRSTNHDDLQQESPLAIPLLPTPSASQIDVTNSFADVLDTPKGGFHNVTKRRVIRSTQIKIEEVESDMEI